MILCSCNRITDGEVRASAKPCGAAADRARDVFRCLGRAPKCGKCVRNIQAAIAEMDSQPALADQRERARA
jgi:bacterioferritin-associated ferredoxin